MNDANSFRILYDGIFIIKRFMIDANFFFFKLRDEIDWDTSINSRKTASFGTPYNYSNISYEVSSFPDYISEIAKKIETVVGYRPNNCLINYYYENNSKMGFHSDQIDILESDTGIIVISLGSSRIIRFKNKNGHNSFDIIMDAGSLLYMTQDTQRKWLHSILPSNDNNTERISITFRKLQTFTK